MTAPSSPAKPALRSSPSWSILRTRTAPALDEPLPPSPALPKSLKKAKSIGHLKSGPKVGSNDRLSLILDKFAPQESVALIQGLLGKSSPNGLPHPDDVKTVRDSLSTLAGELCNYVRTYDNRFLDKIVPSGRLTEDEVDRLALLMKETNVRLLSQPVVGPDRKPIQHLRMFGGGTRADSKEDVLHDLEAGRGKLGRHDRRIKEMAGLMAKVLSPAGFAQLDMVSGLSMGGGLMRAFTMALESHVQLENRPQLVLLDPLLINEKQAQFACEGGSIALDHADLRGIAVTLDYPQAPRPNLMDRQTTLGRAHYPGLVKLKQTLSDTDGRDGGPPDALPFLGYHGDMAYYGMALQRFCEAGEPPVPVLPELPAFDASPIELSSEERSRIFSSADRPLPNTGQSSVSSAFQHSGKSTLLTAPSSATSASFGGLGRLNELESGPTSPWSAPVTSHPSPGASASVPALASSSSGVRLNDPAAMLKLMKQQRRRAAVYGDLPTAPQDGSAAASPETAAELRKLKRRAMSHLSYPSQPASPANTGFPATGADDDDVPHA